MVLRCIWIISVTSDAPVRTLVGVYYCYRRASPRCSTPLPPQGRIPALVRTGLSCFDA